jgi:hypothetical protein
MSLGNKILIESEPKGKFLEGYINGALKPGVMLQLDVSEAAIGGRFTYEAYAPGSDGIRSGPVMILLEDYLQGKLMTEAYVSGNRCFLYIPLAGDEMNIMVGDVSGTADDHAVGQLMIPDNGTGEWIGTTGSPEWEPFMLLEAATDPTADALMRAMHTGY